MLQEPSTLRPWTWLPCPGTAKVRAIDDETASGANLCTEGGSKTIGQGLDALVGMIKQLGFREGGFKKLYLLK